tara:strand:- start:17 stop:682 length:666 start_codon:yes stop_codon:yes gene_type:complete
MKKKFKIFFLRREDCTYCDRIQKLLKKNYSNVIIDNNIKKNFYKINFDYLIAFRSKVIVKKSFLNKIKIAAINFHPGPPKYRGIGCINWAIYNNEKSYGSTCHLMSEKVDYGKILNVKKFKIYNKENLTKILEKTHKNMFIQFKLVENKIYENKFKKLLTNKNRHIWTKKIYKKVELDNLYKINLGTTKKELSKILRATLYKNFKPIVNIHGYNFEFKIKK